MKWRAAAAHTLPDKCVVANIDEGDPGAYIDRFLAEDDVLSLRFEPGAVIVETAKPDDFYARLTALAASGEAGGIDEVTSPDDNLQAVFRYLVKQ